MDLPAFFHLAENWLSHGYKGQTKSAESFLWLIKRLLRQENLLLLGQLITIYNPRLGSNHSIAAYRKHIARGERVQNS